jgi:large subunit ribosomal protein L7A
MPQGQLQLAKKKTIGTKQTMKAVEKGQAKHVFVAADAEEHVLLPLVRLCREKGIPVLEIESMRELGKACGIEVGSASAAILE